MGKLTHLIWQKKIDVEYFMDLSTMSCFKVQLKEMSNLDPMTLYFIPFVYVLSVIAIIYISLNTIRQIDLKIYSRL